MQYILLFSFRQIYDLAYGKSLCLENRRVRRGWLYITVPLMGKFEDVMLSHVARS